MASTAQSAHLPALGEHQLKDVGNTLQAMLVELIDLALFGKQLHWNVTGPLFRPLHEQLDELVDSWRELSDVVAERAPGDRLQLGIGRDRARERMDRLGEIDAASQDVIIEVVRELEKQLWMVRVQFGHAVQV